MGAILKICSIIAEYNPLHNGHIKQLSYVKNVIKPDYIVIIMSGNFTQRGEGAILSKYARARHAINAGADAVIELPSVFATQSAEFFASGAIKLINSLPYEKSVCFGAECGDVDKIYTLAKNLISESQEQSKIIKSYLDKGTSLLKARQLALYETTGIDVDILTKPNNVLGVEYLKAIVKNNYDIEPIVIKREGDYNQTELLSKENPSATAIRQAIVDNNIESLSAFVPNCVLSDLSSTLPDFDKVILSSLLSSTKTELKKIEGCTEGLENRIKEYAEKSLTLTELLSSVSTKRYTTSRIRRILLSNALKIDKKLITTALKSKLYLNVLAISKNKPEILSILSKSKYPLITRKSDLNNLSSSALKVFEKDVFANRFYSLVTEDITNPYNMLII
ncbi:MAG: nucleotidyltransferase family protein [Clostridiales bacterium]|nr:nucleotidyltransferase family protein [Clostridiales bacterium]